MRQLRGKRFVATPGAIALVILTASGLYLLGNASVPLWDRDEPRYAQTSRQMLQSGDWIVPRLLDEPREKKPVFIHWCQAAAMRVFGDNAFAARFPSVVFVTLTLIVIAMVLWNTIGPRRAFWTTFNFATSGLTIAAAKLCITDGVLILFVAVAEICLYAIWCGRGTWPVYLALGVALGLGILTKGPVVPAVLIVTGIALYSLSLYSGRGVFSKSEIRNRTSHATAIKWMLAVVIAAVFVTPWLIAIERRLPGYAMRTLRAEVVERVKTPQEGHRGPPGYYLATIWVTYFPWSLFLPAAIIHAWRKRYVPVVRFALAAVIGPWITFEIVQTKLVHYLLPIFPALAFLTADMLVRAPRLHRRAIVLGIGFMIIVAIIYGAYLPRAEFLQISPRVARVLRDHGAVHPGDAIMIDYKEDSLAFYQGGTIRRAEDRFLDQTSPGEWPRWIVMTGRIWDETSPHARTRLEVITTVRGWWYASGGKMVDILVVRKR